MSTAPVRSQLEIIALGTILDLVGGWEAFGGVANSLGKSGRSRHFEARPDQIPF